MFDRAVKSGAADRISCQSLTGDDTQLADMLEQRLGLQL